MNNHSGLHVRILHSIPILMSAVQVFLDQRMVALSHLVGMEQLGYETDIGLDLEVRSKEKPSIVKHFPISFSPCRP